MMRIERVEKIYAERVARVVAAIVFDPMAKHSLEDLARLANFSPYHFHRVYSSIVGESICSTVRRVRMAQATRLLEEGSESITQIALAVGYESPQAFTRAFGQFTGDSPSNFQEKMHRLELDAGDELDEARVEIVDRPAQRVYALRHHGPFATIPHTQRRLQLLCGTHPLSEVLGASFGDPEDSEGFRYYAAVLPKSPWPIVDAKIEVLEFPTGLYGRHLLAGPYTRINAVIQSLYRRWLPSSGYEPDDRPMLEHYLNSPRTVSQTDLRTELLIPIRFASVAQ